MSTLEFDPNNTWTPNGNYFSLPFSAEESKLVIISIPWDVTVSYGAGTAAGPDAIIDASAQLDLYDANNPVGYKMGIGTIPIDEEIMLKSKFLRGDALKVIEELTEGADINEEYIQKRLRKVNSASKELNEKVYNSAKEWLDKGKIVALVGGDHSVPLGQIKAVSERYKGVGILHFDAHADLRDAYEGFKYSHASIMYNVLNECENVGKLVQVAIRDYCEDELNLIESNPKITTFFDQQLSERKFDGESWKSICEDIVNELPNEVYISFDIDSLSPELCPHTGTPVAGGLSFNEAVFLAKTVVKSGRKIVGFDLCEVAPSSDKDDEWDANVGARILYKLCNLALL